MQKVIFINRFFYPDHSATSQILGALAFSLAKQGYHVEVICSQQFYDKQNKRLAAYEVIYGVKVHRVRSTHFGRDWLPGRIIDYFSFFLMMFFTLLKLAKQDDLIIAKTDPPLTSVLSIIVAKLKHSVHINWVQDLFPEVITQLSSKTVFRPFNQLLIKLRNYSFINSHSNVVIGNLMRNKLLEQGINEDKVIVIENWADGKSIVPIAKSGNQLLNSWHLETKFVVGYSGNMGRVHEFYTIMKAAEVLSYDKEIVFVFIGGGAKKPFILDYVKNHNLSNVKLFPYQKTEELKFSLNVPDVHLISLLPEIEGYCVPSKFYGILAAGKPVLFIGSTQGEISLSRHYSDIGYSVAINDAESLVNKLLYLKNNPACREKLAANARKIFEEQYSLNKAVAKWQEHIGRYFIG